VILHAGTDGLYPSKTLAKVFWLDFWPSMQDCKNVLIKPRRPSRFTSWRPVLFQDHVGRDTGRSS